MEYDDIELLASCVLAVIPAGMLVLIGLVVHKRASAGALGRYTLIGIMASLLYAFIAPSVAMAFVPPPYDPYFAGGRGLDLRGMLLVLGSWVGATLGVGATLIVFGVTKALSWKANRVADTAALND
ncbi:hypothetical protein [Paeniglutamicibacter terrestris]|uniref:Uncharacterized protein n=1 Tax=Paeniglutamicibacter terrestris TaxID=2723403 RepID=A0ABX1G9V5_9MICC|nr:hypothetical protein [Paeniglutamicibacter terrestris]ASN40126.1 hypothetical protein CGQ24_14685 [Arthrobacter sp. 7749]NKG22809.1 hypothetical protein [Paeniglutamicibacter terrestris]